MLVLLGADGVGDQSKVYGADGVGDQSKVYGADGVGDQSKVYGADASSRRARGALSRAGSPEHVGQRTCITLGSRPT